MTVWYRQSRQGSGERDVCSNRQISCGRGLNLREFGRT